MTHSSKNQMSGRFRIGSILLVKHSSFDCESFINGLSSAFMSVGAPLSPLDPDSGKNLPPCLRPGSPLAISPFIIKNQFSTVQHYSSEKLTCVRLFTSISFSCTNFQNATIIWKLLCKIWNATTQDNVSGSSATAASGYNLS